MKKRKGRVRLSREGAARELARLSGQIADGVIDLEDKELALPEEFQFKWKVREKNKSIVLDLSLKGSLKESRGGRENGRSRQGKRRPYEAKKLKKALAGRWKEIRRCIRDKSQFENGKDVLAIMSRYGELSDPGWKESWNTCRQKVVSLLNLMEQGDFETARGLEEEIQGLIKSCHKKYK